MPEGASLIACGNRESDRGVTHRMPTPLASRFVHLDIRVDAVDWCSWATVNGIAAEVIFFIQLRPELLHQFDPQSREAAFACPRTWSFISNILQHRNGLNTASERALLRGTHDAMLVSLRINAWSGRLYDRQASNHVAAHHEASASAGRYNKRLLPKAAFAGL